MLGPFTFIILVIVCMGCACNFAMCYQHFSPKKKGANGFLTVPEVTLTQIGMSTDPSEKSTGHPNGNAEAKPKRTSLLGPRSSRAKTNPPSEKETSRLVQHPPGHGVSQLPTVTDIHDGPTVQAMAL